MSLLRPQRGHEKRRLKTFFQPDGIISKRMKKSHPYHLVINAFALQDQYQNRGIGRYTQEVIQEITRLLETDDPLVKQFEVTLVVSQQQIPLSLSQSLPERMHLWKIPSFVPRRSSTQFLHSFLFVRNSLHRLQEKIKQQKQKSIFFLPHHNQWLPQYFDHTVVMVHDLYPITSGQYSPHRLLIPMKRAEYNYYLHQLEHADLIVTNSAFTAEEVHRYLPERARIVPIPLGISQRFINPGRLLKRIRPTPIPYFMYWGGYDQNKNIQTILDQFVELNESRKNPVGLVLVGGERVINQYQTFVKKHHAQQWLLFSPTVDDETLIHYVGNSLGLVRLSFHEGFGLPEVETMALGKPVISTTAGAVPEITSTFAELFDPANPQGLPAKLSDIALGDFPQSRLAHGQKYAKGLTWQKNVATLFSEIKKLPKKRA